MRRIFIPVALALVAAVLPMSAAGAACATSWGSRPEVDSSAPDSVMVNARVGEHACFDRFVVVLEGEAPGYDVRYVDKFVPGADGRVVDLRGGASLRIAMLGVRAHDDQGQPTYNPPSKRNMVDVSGFRTFRQVYWGGTFEATTTIGLGVRSRLPFRVFTLDAPGDRTRFVVDVAHTW